MLFSDSSTILHCWLSITRTSPHPTRILVLFLFSGSLFSISYGLLLDPFFLSSSIWSELVFFVVKQFSVLDKLIHPIHLLDPDRSSLTPHKSQALVRGSFFVIFTHLLFLSFFTYILAYIYLLLLNIAHIHTHSLESSFTCTLSQIQATSYITLHYIHWCTHRSSLSGSSNIDPSKERTNAQSTQRTVTQTIRHFCLHLSKYRISYIWVLPLPSIHPSFSILSSRLSFSSFSLTPTLSALITQPQTKEPFGTQFTPHSHSYSPSICIKVMAPMVVFFFIFSSHPSIPFLNKLIKVVIANKQTNQRHQLHPPPTLSHNQSHIQLTFTLQLH